MASEHIIRIRIETDDARRNLGDLGGAADGADRRVRNLGESGNFISSSFKNAALALAGFAAAGLSINSVFNATREFEKSLSSLRSITGLTKDEMKFFSDEALRIGETTRFSASEAAKAFQLVASAKPDLLESKDALSAVTNEVIKLASAGGMELEPATASLTQSLNQFGASADEASRYINVLAAGSKYGASEISQTGEALSTVGGIASGLGRSFEETNAALQVMASGGLYGSEAGNQLKGVLSILAKETDEKINPSMHSLSEVFLELKARGNSTADIIRKFGNENANVALNLIKNAESIGAMTEKLTGSNIATEQATINTDNLDGSILSLSSRVEALQLALGDADLFRNVVNAISDFVVVIKDGLPVIGTFAKILAVGGALMLGISAAPVVIGAMSTAFLALQTVVLGNVPIMYAFNTSLFGTGIAATAATGALGVLKIASGVLFAAWAGWEIGKTLYENFVEVRIAGLFMVEKLILAGESLRYVWESAPLIIKIAWEELFAWLQRTAAPLIGTLGMLADTVGASSLSESLLSTSDAMRASTGNTEALRTSLTAMYNESEQNKGRISAEFEDLAAEEIKATTQTEKTEKAVVSYVATTEQATKSIEKMTEAEKKSAKATDDKEQRIKDVLLALGKEVVQLGMNTAERKKYELGVMGATAAQQEAGYALQTIIDQHADAAKAAEENRQAQEKAAAATADAWRNASTSMASMAGSFGSALKDGDMSGAFQGLAGNLLKDGAGIITDVMKSGKLDSMFGKGFSNLFGEGISANSQMIAGGASVVASALGGDMRGAITTGLKLGLSTIDPTGGILSSLGVDLVSGMISEGESRGGQLLGIDKSGVKKIQGPSAGSIAEDQTKQLLTATFAQNNALLRLVGSSQQVVDIKAALETSDKGRGGVYAGGTLSGGGTYGEVFTGQNVFESGTSRSLSGQEALDAYALDLNQSMIQSLQAANDTEAWAQAVLSGVDAESLSMPEVKKVFDDLQTGGLIMNAMGDDAQTFFDAWQTGNGEALGGTTSVLYDLWQQADFANNALIPIADGLATVGSTMDLLGMNTDNLSTSLIDAAGGLGALGESLSFFFNQFTDGSAIVEQAGKQFNEAMTGMGKTVPATRDEFSRMVLDLQAGGADSEEAYAKVLDTIRIADVYYDGQEKAIKDVAKVQTQTVKQSTNTMSQAMDTVKQGATSLLDYVRELTFGSGSTLKNEEQLARAEQTFLSALKGGDEKGIVSSAKTYRELNKQFYGDTEKFAKADEFMRSRLTGIASERLGVGAVYSALGTGAVSSPLDVAATNDRIGVLEAQLLAQQKETNRLLGTIGNNTGEQVRATSRTSTTMRGMQLAAGSA